MIHFVKLNKYSSSYVKHAAKLKTLFPGFDHDVQSMFTGSYVLKVDPFKESEQCLQGMSFLQDENSDAARLACHFLTTKKYLRHPINNAIVCNIKTPSYINGTQACLQFLRRNTFDKGSLIAVNNGVISNKYYHYVNWLINESPYAPAFLIKDVNWAMQHGQVVSTEHGYNYLLGALMCFRLPEEFPSFVDYILNLGVSNRTFVLAHKLSRVSNGNHTIFSSFSIKPTYSVLRNFIKSKYREEVPLYKSSKPVGYVGDIWQ